MATASDGREAEVPFLDKGSLSTIGAQSLLGCGQYSTERNAATRRAHMLNAGAVELSQRHYESLAEQGWWRHADPRPRIGDLHTDWNTRGGATDIDRRSHRDEHDDDMPAVDNVAGRREWWQHGNATAA